MNEKTLEQTSVEWLFEKLWETPKDKLIWNTILIKAKEMEKEQIIDAWNDGYREFYDGSSTPEEYYNQTFKSE
jgi:hypothetical protein